MFKYGFMTLPRSLGETRWIARTVEHPIAQLTGQGVGGLGAVGGDEEGTARAALTSEELSSYLIDNFVVWGDAEAWRSRLSDLAERGCDGVMFILGQGYQAQVVRRLTKRLEQLGELPERSLITTSKREMA